MPTSHLPGTTSHINRYTRTSRILMQASRCHKLIVLIYMPPKVLLCRQHNTNSRPSLQYVIGYSWLDQLQHQWTSSKGLSWREDTLKQSKRRLILSFLGKLWMLPHEAQSESKSSAMTMTCQYCWFTTYLYIYHASALRLALFRCVILSLLCGEWEPHKQLKWFHEAAIS